MALPEEEDLSRTSRLSAVDEAQALNSMITALAPLEQSIRIKLLRTMATFFEFSVDEVLGGLTAGRSQTQSSAAQERQSTPSFSEDRSLSPKAFLLEKRPQSDIERIACLAYFLTHYRDEPTFKTLDLSKLNTEGAQIKFSNPARAVDNAAAAHFLIPAGQGKKQLSAIGEVYVQALPDRAAARAAISDLKRRRARKSRTTGQDDGADSASDAPTTSENDSNGSS